MKSYWSRKQLESLGEPIGLELPSRTSKRVGGGGKGTTVQAPDYNAAAEKTAASSERVTSAQTAANRPNQITPYGTQTWNKTNTFDQSGYDTAMANYAKTATAATPGQEGYYQNNGEGSVWIPAREGLKAGNSAGAAPDRNSFKGADNWTQTTTLTPAAQRALDSQQQMQQERSDLANSLMPGVTTAINKPINYDSMQAFGKSPTASKFSFMDDRAANLQKSLNLSGIPQMPGDDNSAYVQKYVDQANAYMNPSNQAAQSALDTQLSNKGVMQGSEAYNIAQMNLHDQQSRNRFNAVSEGNQQANTMYTNQLAANNQGFNQNLSTANFGNNALGQQQSMQQGLDTFNNTTRQNEFSQANTIANYDNTLRQQQIAEAQMRQLQPLNVMNALVSGQQVSMPGMPSFNTAAASQGVNYSQAAQNQYQAAQAQANASAASSSNMTSGLFSLAGKAAMAYGTGGASLMAG